MQAAPAAARGKAVPPAGLVQAKRATGMHGTGRPPARHVRYRHPAQLRRAKAAALRRYRRRLRKSSTRGRAAPSRPLRPGVFGGLNAPGIGFEGFSPSDSTGSIGPSNYVEIVNSRITVYDRSTLGQVSTSSLDDFLGTPAGAAGDPQIQWDPQSSRWYYLAYEDPSGAAPFHLAFGWSKTADPTTLTTSGWCRFTLDTGTLFPDFPKLGHDNTHVIFGVNAFDGENFVTGQVYALPKPANGSATCPASGPTVTYFGTAASPLQTSNGHAAFTPMPANAADSSPVGYVVAADDPNALMVWHVDESAGGTELVENGDLAVPSFSPPSSAVQPNTDNVVDTLDGRLLQSVGHADPATGGKEAIWTQHTIAGAGDRSIVRWYEIVPADAQVRQVGTIADSQNFVFNGAVSPAANGQDAALFFNASGPSLTPAIRATIHRAAGPKGSMGFPVTLAASSASFNDNTCVTDNPIFPPLCRWGDYAGASPDPVNSNVVWGSEQYSGGSEWLTRNFAVEIVPGGPTAAIAASPNPATAGKTVTFDASGSTDVGATINRYVWDLDGNGSFETSSGSSPTVTHKYSSAGTYAPRVRVTDVYGDQSQAKTSLTVKPAPGPTPACQAATKKRKKLAHSVANLKNHVKNSHGKSKQRYQRLLKQRRAEYKKAQADERAACATSRAG